MAKSTASVRPSDDVALRFVVQGRVQGVGFRWATKDCARELGLIGWVQNRSDGAVVGEVRGAPDDIVKFCEYLQRGPRSARVSNCDTEAIEPHSVEDTLFRVRR